MYNLWKRIAEKLLWLVIFGCLFLALLHVGYWVIMGTIHPETVPIIKRFVVLAVCLLLPLGICCVIELGAGFKEGLRESKRHANRPDSRARRARNKASRKI